jgi:ADP-heptose:LPS heptosyltransferase
MSVRNNLLKAVDATVGALMCRFLSLSPRAINHADKFPDLDRNGIGRILLIRPGGMGDMVVLWPVIRMLEKACPAAEIDIVCEKRNISVLKIAGFKGRAMVYDGNPFSFLAQIRSNKYDLAIDTEQFHHFSAVFAFLSGAPARIGFKINPRRNSLYTHLVNYSLEGYEGDQFLELVRGVLMDLPEYDLKGCMSGEGLEVPATVSERIPGGDGYAVLQPGASTHYKQWSLKKYADLVSGLLDQHEMSVVYVGDGQDVRRCVNINARVSEGERCLSLAGELDLMVVAVLIKGARVFVGSDSGLAHLAVALGVPTVILFGPSDHRKWGVENGQHAVVRKDMPCSPCFIFGYNKPCDSIACMQQIEPADVLSSVEAVL